MKDKLFPHGVKVGNTVRITKLDDPCDHSYVGRYLLVLPGNATGSAANALPVIHDVSFDLRNCRESFRIGAPVGCGLV